EVRALLAGDVVPRRLSRQGLASYLRFGSVAGADTMIDGVHNLPPAHYLTVELRADGLHVQRRSYLDRIFKAVSDTPKDRQEGLSVLRAKLEDSVRLHLVSDVPLAAFLSGGIDSTAVVGLIARVTRDRPKTFTVVFGEEEFSEKAYAD